MTRSAIARRLATMGYRQLIELVYTEEIGSPFFGEASDLYEKALDTQRERSADALARELLTENRSLKEQIRPLRDHIATITEALEADSAYWKDIASECTDEERAERVRKITEAQAAVAELENKAS